MAETVSIVTSSRTIFRDGTEAQLTQSGSASACAAHCLPIRRTIVERQTKDESSATRTVQRFGERSTADGGENSVILTDGRCAEISVANV